MASAEPPDLIAWLLAGIPPDKFLSDYFERQPLYLTGRAADHYGPVLRFEDLDAIMAQSPEHVAKHLTLTRKGLVEQFRSTEQGVDTGRRLREAFARGNTIVVGRLQLCSLPIARLTRALEEWLGCTASATIFLTPTGSQGFPRHFDEYDTIMLQIEGRKRWRIYGPEVELPMERQWWKLNGVAPDAPRQKLWMQPGDLLYIPRGVAHEAMAGDGPSLHLTLPFRAYRWRDLLVDLVDELAEQDASVRHAASVVFPQADGVEPPPAVARLIAALAPASVPAAIDRSRERLVESLSALPTDLFPRRPIPTVIRSSDRLQRVAGAIASVRRRGDLVVLSFPGDRLQAPLAAEAALRFMAGATTPFTVRSLPGSLKKQARLTLVTRLVSLGFLTVVENEVASSAR